MLSMNFPEMHCILSSASTSDSDEQGCCRMNNMMRNQKLKNQLCRNYLNFGFCRYFDKCQFAHGIQELRQSMRSNMKYKTKECQSYFVKGCCQYGQRCNFLHRRKDESFEESTKLKEMRMNFREIIDGDILSSRILQILKE